jgi:hypothetical protein
MKFLGLLRSDDAGIRTRSVQTFSNSFRSSSSTCTLNILRFKLAYMEDTKRVMYLLPWPWIWSRKSLWRLVYPPLWTQLILILLDDLDHTQINMQPVAKFITKRLCCSQTSAKFNVPSTLVLIVSTLCDSHQSTLGLPVSNIENMVWFFVFGIVVAL